MSVRALREDQVGQARAMRRAGQKIEAIAAYFGVSRSTIGRAIVGVRPDGYRPRYDETHVECRFRMRDVEAAAVRRAAAAAGLTFSAFCRDALAAYMAP